MNFRLLFTLLFCSISLFSFGQKQTTFYGTAQKKADQKEFSDQFTAYEIYEIDAAALNDFAKSGAIDVDFKLKLGDKYDWNFSITPHDIRGENYVLSVQTANGVATHQPTEIKTFRGALEGNTHSTVALTLDTDFIYGYVRTKGGYVFIEPAHYFDKTAPVNQFVVYESKNVIPSKGTCGAMELSQNKDFIEQHSLDHSHEVKGESHIPDQKSLACYEVELAIASDSEMFADFGTVAGVENHNIGVNNNVITDYDTDFFTHEIIFVIVEQFVITNGNDPWPEAAQASPDAGDYLNDFTNWGNGGGFTNSYDLASLWTGANLNGGTIGVAWLSGVCTNFRYNLLENFSSNANLKRVLVSHEYGHNFSSQHDAAGSGFIMAPSVNNTATWSTQSQNSINNFTNNLINNGCVSLCGPAIPPTAAFTSNYNPICAGSFVTFLDQSTDSPSSWSWSFPGATPSSSSDQNPTVTYNNPGSYTVSLTVTNGNGSNTTSQTISVGSGTDFFHFADFENGLNGWTVENIDGSTTWGAASVPSSRFGNTSMRMDNFNYNATGQRDAIVSPQLDFSGRTFINLEFDYAYARFSNTFRDSMVVYVSTNDGASFIRVFAATEDGNGNFATAPQQGSAFTPDDETEWCFGTTFGSGCLSLDLTPFAGASQARIKIENVNGFGNNMYVDNIRVTSDCQILLPPIADFTSSNPSGCVPFTVDFTDLSQNGPTSWSWIFDGGTPNSSSQQNPSITYSTPGIYDVTLIATNSVGTNSTTQFQYVVVEDVPVVDYDYTISDLTVTFNNLTNTTGTYIWNFGDGNSSIEENPIHTYDAGGTYTVTLTVSNGCGTDALIQTFDLALPPVAVFTADVTSGCVPMTVQFSDQSSNIPTSWDWSFTGGSPSTSNAQNPSVTYDTPGVYDVTLTVTNSAGTDVVVETNYIVVEDVPDANFTSNIDGQTIDFFNNTINAATYLWDFGDGVGSSTDFEPIYDYPSDGTYTVVLEATNACGTDIFEETITIATPPDFADFTANANAGCVPMTIDFTDNSPDNVTSWLWEFEGGDPATSTNQNPTVVYNTAGTFDVKLTVSNAQGTVDNTQTDYITIQDVPTAAFSSVVSDSDVDFTNNSTNADTYNWDFGDGAGTSNNANPSYTYTADGTYTVTLTATNVCGTVTTTQQVVIANPPTAGFGADVTAGCAPLTVQFSNQSSDNVATYAWDFPGGTPASSTDENPIVVYTNAGTFTVTLTVSNATGTDTFTQTELISVNDVPAVDFTSLTNNQTVDFTNNSTNADSYAWDFGDGTGTSTDINPTYIYAADGSYNVTLMATNACGTSTTTVSVEVSTFPQAAFTANATTGCAPLEVQFMNASSANTTTVLWSFPGGNPATSTDMNPTVTYANAGVYDVTLTATNDTGSDVTTETSYIVVNDVPTAGFSSTGTNGMLSFTNASVDATSYSWDFGDGMGTSLDENPSYTYSDDGTYTVLLTATNACGSSTSEETITVVLPPTAGFSANVTTACVGETIQFMDESSDNVDSWAWQFSGGTPTTSTEQNPSITYAMPGTYSVILDVSNSAGTTNATQTNYITIIGVPEGDFSSTIDNAQVDFTQNINGATAYAWDFGDGMGSSMDADPSYTYPADGTYIVTLTASNACGSVTSTQEITILTPPTAAFTASTTVGCEPLTVQFTSQSSENATAFSWSFPGGNPATSMEENPTVVYETAGVYSVTLTVSNAAGDNMVMEMNYIVVNGFPTAAFGFTTDDTSVNFNNSTNNATSYSWDFGDGMGTSDEENPSYTYQEDGAYTVTLTASNDCGDVTSTEIVVIATAAPIAAFQSEFTEGCPIFTVTFENLSSENATNFLWTFEGGNPATSTEENPTVSYDTPGTYDVTLMAENPLGDNSFFQEDYITVFEPSDADFSFALDNSEVTFTNNSTNATTFEWQFGNGVISTDENPVYEYPQTGTYNVQLIAFGNCEPDTITQEIMVSAVPPLAFFDAEERQGCSPLIVTFEDLSTGDPTSYEWTFDGGDPAASTEENPTVTYTQAGIYDVSLTVNNSAGSHTFVATQYVTVKDIPTAIFEVSTNELVANFDNLSVDGNDFLWDFGDGTESTIESPAHLYEEAGIYTVILTVTNECGVATFTQEVQIIVDSVEDLPGLNAFNVFPNPNSGQFTLVMEGQPLGDLELNIYNIIGQRLTSELVTFGGSLTHQFDISAFAKGVYVLEIGAGNKAVYQRIIVE